MTGDCHKWEVSLGHTANPGHAELQSEIVSQKINRLTHSKASSLLETSKTLCMHVSAACALSQRMALHPPWVLRIKLSLSSFGDKIFYLQRHCSSSAWDFDDIIMLRRKTNRQKRPLHGLAPCSLSFLDLVLQIFGTLVLFHFVASYIRTLSL